MKKKTLNKMLGLSVAAVMTLTSPAVLWAAQAEEKTEASDTAQEDKPEDLKIAADSGEITVKNESGHVFTKAELKINETKAGDKAEEASKKQDTAQADSVQEDAGKLQEDGLSLVLTEEGGDIHTFESVTAEEWNEAKVFDKYGFLYVNYKDKSGKDQEVLETAEEKEFDQPLAMYVSTNVHIRKEADKDSESLKILSLGDECQATAAMPGWFKVKNGDITGYVYHSYITEDKASVDAAVKAQKEAEAQAAAEAAAQAAADAAADYVEPEAPAQEAPQEIYEVSRQQFDDCDGSGHGYYEITYSDGSVAYEEY
ncbi:MAG: hypothetical protein Q4D16_25850 [Eubacteriales bacterium]|nr:hypothetical protein [Eubacteriales bacterium]